MITDIQRKWLEKYVAGMKTKRDEPHKHSVYMGRIRKRIDHQFENLLWISNNMPEVLRDEEWEINEFGSLKHRRLKMLLQVVKGLYPHLDPQLARSMEEIGLPPPRPYYDPRGT